MRFDAGYVKVPRWWASVLEKAPPAWAKVWMFVAMEANINPRLFDGRVIQPGQMVTSVANLAHKCGVTVDQTRAALRAIQKANAGTVETTNRYSVITLFDSIGCGRHSLRESHAEPQAESQEQPQSDPKQQPNNIKNRERRIESGARFSPPTPAEVSAYGVEIGFPIDGERFCDYYESRGWLAGKVKMKSWRAAVRTWRNREADSARGEAPIGQQSAEPQYISADQWQPHPEDNTLFGLSPNGEVTETPKPGRAGLV
jgi:hypothetical protein